MQKLINTIPNNITDEDYNNIISNTNGYVGADISLLINQSCLHALKTQYPIINDLSNIDNEKDNNFILYKILFQNNK